MSTSPVAVAPNVVATFREAAQVFKPPQKLTVTEWAEQNFVLSSEDSAVTGPYRVARAPYQREPLDAIADPEVEEVVMQCAAQTMKTLIFKIWIAYFVKEDPSSMIYVLPDIPLAKRVSRQRLAPMFRDVPILQGLLEQGANKAGNATLEKSFPGGVLFLVGANSPAGLASVPVRIMLADETNRYPVSAGSEGDPLKLAEERTSTFWNAKKAKASTPTDDYGVITRELELSDDRRWFVPCPHCSTEEEIRQVMEDPEPRLFAVRPAAAPAPADSDKASESSDNQPPEPPADEEVRILPACYQVLTWKRMVLDKEEPHTGTSYPCEACGAEILESDKQWMNARGRWIPLRPEVKNKRGYQISALYSPFVTWAKLAKKFLDAMKDRHNPELLKAFVNLSLAETFNEEAEALSGEELMGRREDYPAPLPEGVVVVTAAVDVQHDRLEFIARGWGKGQESWLVDRKVFVGDTSKLKGTDGRLSPWEELDQYHDRAHYRHARGVRLRIYCMFVDSGDQTQVVYEFTKPRQSRWVYATKGIAGFGKPPLGNFTKNNRLRARLYLIAVDEVKRLLHRRLRIQTPGAGYVHFSRQYCDAQYFAQLTAERLKWKSVHGKRVPYWEKAVGAANEALDLEVLAYAALLKLSPDLEAFLEGQRARILEEAKHVQAQRRGEAPDPNQLTLPEPAEDEAQDQAAAEAPTVQTPAMPPAASGTPPQPDPPAQGPQRFRARMKF